MDVVSASVNRGWLLTLGVILIIVGFAAICLPFIATLAVELLIGWVLVIGGIVKAIHSFSSQRWGQPFLRLIVALIYLAVGILMLVYPLQGVLTLTLVLAILFLLEGLFKIIAAVQLRAVLSWGWMFFSGILALIIGGLIWACWPSSAIWAIGLLVGINIIFGGWAMVMISLAARE